MNNFIADVLAYMGNAGLPYADRKRPEPVFDGALHRHHIEGDKMGSKNGWHVGGIYYANGATQMHNYAWMKFGSWRTGNAHSWASANIDRLSEHQKFEIRQNQELAAQRYKTEQATIRQNAAADCARIWASGRMVDATHPYLTRKSVKPFGIRQLKNSLLIPVRDINGRMTSLQFIAADGRKTFKTGGRVKGCFHGIGAPINNTIYIAEGYATGATIHQLTGHAIAIAFNARNIIDVTKNIRNKYLGFDLVIAADNDRFTADNPGVSCAQKAAEIAGAEVLIPEFPDGAVGTDFNDLMQLEVSYG